MTFSFGLCFHKNGGIMSVDLRNSNRNTDTIRLLDNKNKNPLIFNYDISESYYELTAKGFKIGNLKISVTPITLMVDSGTTFTHFPTSYVWKILSKLNEFCETNISKCGKLKTPNFEEDSCLELK